MCFPRLPHHVFLIVPRPIARISMMKTRDIDYASSCHFAGCPGMCFCLRPRPVARISMVKTNVFRVFALVVLLPITSVCSPVFLFVLLWRCWCFGVCSFGCLSFLTPLGHAHTTWYVPTVRTFARLWHATLTTQYGYTCRSSSGV